MTNTVMRKLKQVSARKEKLTFVRASVSGIKWMVRKQERRMIVTTVDISLNSSMICSFLELKTRLLRMKTV